MKPTSIADLRGKPNAPANARLIAAAPEMLEALLRAEFLMRRVTDGDHRALENLRSAADQAQAVIAKAIAA